MNTKFIFVTGGVVSGLGKGITAASLGRLLKDRGFTVMCQKLDPYINVDPGTISPYEHGEVFVTEDGAETDLDLGHYERFIDINLSRYSTLTAGKVYWDVLNKERKGVYLGKTIQVIPHITNEIKDYIYKAAETSGADFLITEIGGTVGDIESQPFIEAIRQISLEVGKDNSLFIHVTLVPHLKGSDEHKSKPTQHSVKELRSLGLSPDIIVARVDEPLSLEIRQKISLFCNVLEDCVIENLTVDNIYQMPLMLEAQNFSSIVLRQLNVAANPLDNAAWHQMLERVKQRKGSVKIAIVGKYVKSKDAYLSIVEAFNHASFLLGTYVDIKWIEAEELTADNVTQFLGDVSGILVPGGFGFRGVAGKMLAAKYARENNIAYFGICFGMQTAVIEFAQNVLGVKNATTREIEETPEFKKAESEKRKAEKEGQKVSTKPQYDYVIDFMPSTKGKGMGGTMRLGAYVCILDKKGKIYNVYNSLGAVDVNDKKQSYITERHRHRYEFLASNKKRFEKGGMLISGTSEDGTLVECIEIPSNNFFVGVQYHPEFKSRPDKPHPLFVEFVRHSINFKK
ncbi:MAG: CTP synthase [Firmicutes bacterium]|nr:CTP synthase [Bacillota bacterium]